MRIAIDVSPLQSGHKVRGVGFYLDNLKKALLKNHPENNYIFFNNTSEIPTDTDLVHYPYFDPFFVTLPINKKHKTVITVHDLTPLVFPEHFPAGIRGKLNWQIQKSLLKRMDAVITDSESSKKDIIKYTSIPEDKVDVVYLAAGEEFRVLDLRSSENDFPRTKNQELRTKYNLPQKFILYVGDVTWNKNLPNLIEACIQLGNPLVMVGKAIIEENYDKSNPWNYDLVKVQNLAKENKNIKRVGFVPTDDLVLFYNMATALVMPSRYEGFGLPIVEAMRAGCPVITTKRGSLEEVARDAAIYVDPESIGSIVDGIKKVWEDEPLQKLLSEKGILQAKKFSWDKTATDTLKVYQRVVK